MLLSKLIKNIDNELPLETAMDFDKVGLQIQSGKTEIIKILIALEVTDEVIDEAIIKKCDCLIVFHPLIFRPLDKVTDGDRVGKLCTRIIQNSISLIASHTNFDSFPEGTSKILSDLLGLKKLDILVKDVKYEGRGMGVVSEFETEVELDELLEKVHSICNGSLRYTLGEKSRIKKVAIVGGSGSSFISDALKSGADAFITADVSYHNYHLVRHKMALIDPGHYEMEQFVPRGMKSLLDKIVDDGIETELSENLTNPVHYFPDLGYRSKQKSILL